MFKMYYKDYTVSQHNEYITYNPNGKFIDYDFTDLNSLNDTSNLYFLIRNINEYNGVYTERIGEIIIEYKDILARRIHSATYLPYDFIIENHDIFVLTSLDALDDFPYIDLLCKNKTLTIDNVLFLYNKLDYRAILLVFTYANITIEDIINNNLHEHKYFYKYVLNKNCTINDIINYPNLNWMDNNSDCPLIKFYSYLAQNKHEYIKHEYIKYKFTFID